MRRATRTIQSGKQPCIQITQMPYVCSACRHQARLPHLSHQQAMRHASSGLPLTERLRRRIWGTDSPPGLEDPYGGPRYLEKRRLERQGGDQPEETAAEPAAEELNILESEAVPRTAQKPHVPRERGLRPENAWGSVYNHNPVQFDPNYVPAETWDGLERVGRSPRWGEKSPGAGGSFRPFLSISSKASTREEFISSLHQAVVEVVTLKTSLQSISTDLSQISYTAEALASIAATAIELNVTGKQIALKYPESGRETILAAFSGNSDHVQDLSVSEQKDFGAEDRSPGTSDDLASGFEGHIQEVQAQQDHFNAGAADEQQNHAVTEDSEEFDEVNERSSAIDSVEQLDPKTRTSYTVTSLKFLTLPLGSLELRFWIMKRLSQLTGHRIPDPLFTSSETLMPVYNYLIRNSNPKPKKLADGLLRKQDLVSLPNVHIMARRETPVDKDKQLGRWKVIAAELESKGLPVLSKSRV